MCPSPNHIHSIAIVGASGTIGSYITSSLLQNTSFNLTALTRHSSTTAFPSTLKTACIDYSDPQTIVSALHGHDALIITLAVSAPPSTQETLIRAAAQAGVKWILPNEFGMYNTEAAQADTVGDGKMRARQMIERLGMSWIGLTCGFWYEHSLASPELFGINITKRKATLFDEGVQKLNVSTWGFVGNAVGKILSLPASQEQGNDDEGCKEEVTLSHYKNTMVFVSSFTVSQRDMLESVQRVTETTEEEWKITKVDAKKRFEDAKEKVRNGDRSAFGRCLYTRYLYDDEGLFEKSHGLDNERLGLGEEDLDEATRRAVDVAESGYWETYGKR